MPYCSKCGGELRPNDVFCPRCGTRINASHEEPQRTTSRQSSSRNTTRPRQPRQPTTRARCAFCNGTGKTYGSLPKTCPVCKGLTYVTVRDPPEPCNYCNGTGRDSLLNMARPCRVCKGTGYTNFVK